MDGYEKRKNFKYHIFFEDRIKLLVFLRYLRPHLSMGEA
jgi:hypothetical protein